MALLLSIVMYAGCVAILAGALAIVRPMRRVGLATRSRGARVLLAGAVLVAIALVWPTPSMQADRSSSVLDEKMPVYQFVEFHETRVHATPARVFEAIRQVTAGDIRFFSLLTWIRRPHFGRADESILAAPHAKPILDVALSSGFRVLGGHPDEELVIGTMVAPRVAAAMNFRVRPGADGWSRLTTETRVFGTDRSGVRAFTTYWRLIYPGSALIRVEWLRAIRLRAER